MSTDPVRLLAASAALLIYLALCGWIALTQRRQRHRGRSDSSSVSSKNTVHGDQVAPWIIAFASQTGTAEALAQQTAQTLRLADVAVQVIELSTLSMAQLANTERLLLVVSTYGEGDAPDNGAAFAQRLFAVQAAPSLTRLHFAVLALGDSSYQEYCGFGKVLDLQLQALGARSLFERIEVDRGDAHAIALWRQQLSHLAGTSDAPDWAAPAYSNWRLTARRQLNPGSVGAPVFHLEFSAPEGQNPAWQAGDLVQLAPPTDNDRPRDYSIANIPSEQGRVALLVRLHQHADGSFGHASGWLTQVLAIGDIVALRVRAHRRFQLGDNATRPLILIGNGTGIAGLRAHLQARIQNRIRRNWLIFGERNAAHDFHYRDELQAWLADGSLERLDTAFSRDQTERIYVQHQLRAAAQSLREWVEQGAAIYVCGSLTGMADGVDTALREVLGATEVAQLSEQGRYRRDVY